MSLEALQLAANQWSIKALVRTTHLSNPLGGTMPEERQKQLLRLASDFDIQVVEDDIYGELMFGLGRTKALKAYDRLDRVIYCSSFSKTLSPGIRIGWMIAGKYQQEIQRLQMFSTHSACSVTQMGAAAYLENGGYDRHLRYIRQEYRKNLTGFGTPADQVKIANDTIGYLGQGRLANTAAIERTVGTKSEQFRLGTDAELTNASREEIIQGMKSIDTGELMVNPDTYINFDKKRS